MLPKQPYFPSSACLLSQLVKLFREERPDGSLRTFVQGYVAVRRNPYPSHYSSTFASSVIRYPQHYGLPLRVAFLNEKHYGLTKFRMVNTMG